MQKIFISAFIAISLFACTSESSEKKESAVQTPKLKKENVKYNIDTLKMDSYVVFDENLKEKRPMILVIPEWWGLNDYAKRRADELAEMGYLAMAVDMYGNGRKADNPKDAGALASPFYQNPAMTKSHFDAAMNKLKTFAVADTNNIGAMGYCFGGAVVLNVARMGENLKGAVSFHGGLLGTPPAKDLLKAKVLVLHGEDDKFVSPKEVATFKKQMDSIGASYSFKGYPGATHAFTNPDATENGKKFNIPIAYNAAADSASFKEMKTFFADLFKK